MLRPLLYLLFGMTVLGSVAVAEAAFARLDGERMVPFARTGLDDFHQIRAFDPSADLSADTLYTARVTNAATDLAGNALAGPEVWTIEYPFTEAKMADVARSVPDFASLADALISPQDPDDAKIEEFFRAHSGATRRTLAGIEQLLTSR